MKKSISLLTNLILASTLFWSVPTVNADGVTTKVAADEGNYCHMKFPAMREETLSSDRPVLKDAASGDLIDFYGPCDHDPTGKDEIESQKNAILRGSFMDGD